MSFLTQNLILSDEIETALGFKVKSINTKLGSHLYKGKRICELINVSDESTLSIKAQFGGIVSKLFIKSGSIINLGDSVIEVKACLHPTILGNICCDCGVVLEKNSNELQESDKNELVSMLHSIPDLKVSKEEATRVGNEDIKHLLDKRKLVLLVDLDQTLIHTTNDNIPPKLKDVFHFQLIPNGHWYHTRVRPYTNSFLNSISKLYELHICTFGVREYAHCIASFLDTDRKLFGDRILSRNECLDPMSKKANLSSLFPCGDNLVCIIDDRSDVWNFAPNVVQVMPYHFFQHTGDINAPPGLQKKENDNTSRGYDFSNMEEFNSNKRKEKDKDAEEEDKKAEDNTTEENCDYMSDIDKPNGDQDKNKPNGDQDKDKPNGDQDKDKPNGDQDKTTAKKDESHKNHDESPEKDESYMKSEAENNEENKCTPTEAEVNDDILKQESETQGDFVKKEKKENKEKLEDDFATFKSTDSDTLDVATFKSTDSDTLDVDDDDDYLLYLEDILRRLHAIFYKEYDAKTNQKIEVLPDLKEIVPNTRKKVLSGCNLVLSCVIPQNTNLSDSKAYHIATSLGATVSQKIIVRAKGKENPDLNYTTHVVAANLHTEKVHQAKRIKSVNIVTPNWLWCCAERWEHVDERLFRLTDESEKTVSRNPPLHCLVNTNQPRDIILLDKPVHPKPMLNVQKEENVFKSLNPLAYMSDDETKKMENEVDDILSEEDNENEEDKLQDNESSNSEDDSFMENIASEFNEDDDEDFGVKKKRRRTLEEDDFDDDEDEEEEEEELPSIRFRQGGYLSSEENNSESGDDEDMNAYGDILERELMGD